MVDQGGGTVAIRAGANNMYVCAENGGGSALIANRYSPGPWETFTLITNGDGSFSLRAQANGRLVCAEGAGGSPLIANRDGIGQWERFDLIRL
jgi:alpha-L-fucosidase 2